MGMFHYGEQIELLDDEDLAALEVVVASKLSRAEPFLVTFEGGLADATTAYWIHEQADLQFDFTHYDGTTFDRARVEAMVRDADTARGVRLEPAV